MLFEELRRAQRFRNPSEPCYLARSLVEEVASRSLQHVGDAPGTAARVAATEVRACPAAAYLEKFLGVISRQQHVERWKIDSQLLAKGPALRRPVPAGRVKALTEGHAMRETTYYSESQERKTHQPACMIRYHRHSEYMEVRGRIAVARHGCR